MYSTIELPILRPNPSYPPVHENGSTVVSDDDAPRLQVRMCKYNMMALECSNRLVYVLAVEEVRFNVVVAVVNFPGWPVS